MKDAWLGKPVIDQLRHAIPCETALLTAPPERSPPEVGYMMSERRKRPAIGRHRIVGEVAGYDLPQPSPLLRDRLVDPAPKLRLDVLQLGQHAVATGLPLKLEASAARCPQMKVKPKNAKVSGFPSPPNSRSVAAKRPNLIRRVLSGWSDSTNSPSLSRIASRKRRASPSCSKPTTRSSA